MIPLPILLDRVGELSTTIAYQRLTVAAISWVDLDDGTLPPPGRQVARAVVRAASEADDAAADARSLTFLLLDDPDAAALSRLGKNVVAVETGLSPLAFAQQLQACALELMEWERTLDRIALADGTLQDFLTASEAVIGNFINISDSSFRLIAYTKGIVLDDPAVAAYIERGYHDEATVARFRATHAMERWKRQRKSQYHEAPEGKKHPFINYVFRVNSSYYMQMVMTCHRTPFTPGLSAKFDILAQHIQQHIRRIDTLQDRTFEKSAAFLLDMLRGESVEPRHLRQQARQLRISVDAPLRLYELSPLDAADATVMWSARRIAERLPECPVLPHEERIFVVTPREPDNPWRDDARVEAVLAPLAASDGYVLAASGIVEGLARLPLALDQAVSARLMATAAPLAEGRPALRHFELGFLAYALSRRRPSTSALDEAARQSILGFLQQDGVRGAEDADFLMVYYEHHCKAAETARALGVHRNTVANRLHALEERFGADLARPELEQSLRACALLLR